MRRWTRAPLEIRCGLCRATIPAGAPVLIIEIAGGLRRPRCEACVGPAPEDLPPVRERAPITPIAKARFQGDMLPLDWKRIASQDREPGEEG